MNLLSDNKYMLMDQYEIEDTVPSSQENIKFYGLQNSTRKKIKTHFWIWIWSSQDEIILKEQGHGFYIPTREKQKQTGAPCVRQKVSLCKKRSTSSLSSFLLLPDFAGTVRVFLQSRMNLQQQKNKSKKSLAAEISPWNCESTEESDFKSLNWRKLFKSAKLFIIYNCSEIWRLVPRCEKQNPAASPSCFHPALRYRQYILFWSKLIKSS